MEVHGGRMCEVDGCSEMDNLFHYDGNVDLCKYHNYLAKNSGAKMPNYNLDFLTGEHTLGALDQMLLLLAKRVRWHKRQYTRLRSYYTNTTNGDFTILQPHQRAELDTLFSNYIQVDDIYKSEKTLRNYLYAVGKKRR